ncbi:MAG: hypothetical protein NTZ50_14850 [Chloroflexi bacterium]|nr:hypothetical protein [Chloroflexota bacterium]
MWIEQGITRYEVTWLLLEGGDAAPDRYRSAHVVNNNVLDTLCPQQRCPEAHLRDLRTIHDAFKLIRDNAEQCDITVLYHVMLHYPTWIRANCAHAGLPDFRVMLRGFAAE